MSSGQNDQVSQSHILSSGVSTSMMKYRDNNSGPYKLNLVNNSRRNSNNHMAKVTPQDLKGGLQGNLSFMNPLNNISDIDHVLSEFKLETHLHQNVMSGQKQSNDFTNQNAFIVKDESVMKVRTERAYQRLINRNKHKLFQGVASVNTLPSEMQIGISKSGGIAGGLTSFS